MIANNNPEYFLTVIREGSFSRAAERLYVSQPYLSQHISRLEKEFGAALINRKKSPLEPTPAGRIYQNYLENSHFLYKKMRSELDSLSGGREQTLRIGLGTWRGSLLIPAILPEFLRTHENALIDLQEYPVNHLAALIPEGGLDFAIMNTAVDAFSEGVSVEVLLHERILLVLNHELPACRALAEELSAGQPPNLGLLSELCLISLGRSLTVGSHVNNYLERNYFNFARQIFSRNTATMLALAAEGLGVCFMVESGRSELSRFPHLEAFDLHCPDLMIPLSIVRSKSSFISPLAQDFIELIRRHYARAGLTSRS